MNTLYLSRPVRNQLGPCLRPGGTIITEKFLEYIRPIAEDMILDAGCGTGATLSLLREKGFNSTFGIDINGGLLQEAHEREERVLQADLARIPLPDAVCDTVLCECVWNLTDRKNVLHEFYRIIRPGGYLALSDIFLRENIESVQSWPVQSCFNQATSLACVQEMVNACGFEIVRCEDYSPLLTHAAAEFVFAHGSLHGFWQAVTGDEQLATCACNASAATRPGLFLLIAQRSFYE